MKPTISNAFNDGSAESDLHKSPAPGNKPASTDAWDLRKPISGEKAGGGKPRNPRKSLASSLTPMQVDLREAGFGWSLELTPITAVDALQGLKFSAADPSSLRFMISMEQSAWRDGENDMPISEIALRLAIPYIEKLGPDELVMDELSLRQLVSLCQPTRLLVAVVEGPIDARDAEAMNKAVDAGRSPLLAELRAIAALEVLGDRAVVLHSRERELALGLVAENFRHYLAALSGRPMSKFDAPEGWQVDRLLSLTGMLTVRPIETQVFSTSIDIGINTSKERFTQPADRSLIYDIPSNSWHDEL